MHIELGRGPQRIIYFNSDKILEIDTMLARIAIAYKSMLAAGYPSIVTADRNCRLIFTSESPVCTGLRIDVSSRPCGIYTDMTADHKHLARRFYAMTGLATYDAENSNADLEIGVGGIAVSTQGYVLLKDALLGLAYKI